MLAKSFSLILLLSHTLLTSSTLLANNAVFNDLTINTDEIDGSNLDNNKISNSNIGNINIDNNVTYPDTDDSNSSTISSIAKKQFRIGTQDFDYSPQYNFISHGDKGFAWAVLEAFAKHRHIEFKYVPLPLKRLQSELRKGNIDFVYPDNARWHKGEKHHLDGKTFSEALTMAEYGTMVQRQREGIGIENFRSVTYPKGFVPTKWKHLYEQDKLQLVETSTAELAIKMVLRGRADGADIELSVTQFILRNLNRPGELVMDDTLPVAVVGFRLATIHYEDLIYQLNHFMDDNKSLLNELHNRYGLSSELTRDKHTQQAIKQQGD